MAKRCVTQYALEGVSHNFMTFNDFSFLVDNPSYGTNVGNIDSKISSYGDNICQIHLSDSEYLHSIDGTSILWQKELSTSYSGYTNFNMWLNNLNTIVISNGMLTNQVSSNWVCWSIILDDEEELGWVVSRHVDNNCYVCGGHNDTGALIYYAFVRGVISPSGGAGSGYIGNTLVGNKKMVGYNVPTSSAESTKTESVNEASESPVSGKPKIGNGFAKIKLVHSCTDYTFEQLAKSLDFTKYKRAPSNRETWTFDELSEYFGSDYLLECAQYNYANPTYSNGEIDTCTDGNAGFGYIAIPLIPKRVVHIHLQIKYEVSLNLSGIFWCQTDNNHMETIASERLSSTSGWVTKEIDIGGNRIDYLAFVRVATSFGKYYLKDMIFTCIDE